MKNEKKEFSKNEKKEFSENEKKEFSNPCILKEEKYQTANIEHCHQVKEECMPYQMKA